MNSMSMQPKVTYGHLFEGNDQESAERMDRIFPGVETEPPRKQVDRIHQVRRPNLKFRADKNADKTALGKVREAVSG